MITRHDISFIVSVVSQFMQTPRKSHLDAVVRILRFLMKNYGQGLFSRNMVIFTLKVIQVLIGQDLLLDYAHLLEVFQSLGRIKSKVL